MKRAPKRSQRSEEQLVLAVLRAAAAITHRSDLFFRQFDITQSQYNVLRILRGAGPSGLCRNEIAHRMINATPDMSRMLERMETAGLLARERSTTDRRNVSTIILPAGLDLLDRIDLPLRAMQRELLPAWTTDQQETVLRHLEQLRASAERATPAK